MNEKIIYVINTVFGSNIVYSSGRRLQRNKSKGKKTAFNNNRMSKRLFYSEL